jgi:phage-related protein (TIGR01555 family)
MPPAVIDRAQQTVKLKTAIDAMENIYAQRMMQRKPGGLYNPLSGAGGPTDKSAFFTFIPYWLNDTAFIERVVNQSWVAERFVAMPVDDMFAKPRMYTNPKFKEEFSRLKIDNRAAAAMRLGRMYGTGLFWMVTREAPPDTPFDIRKIRPGDAVNCIAIDRTDATILARNKNVMSPSFNEPEIYQIRVHGFGSTNVHASRIYRADGQSCDSINGWRSYEKDWGVSSLVKVMTDVFNDVSVVEAISQLMQESSIPVHKVNGLNEILSRGKLPDEPDVDEMMQMASMYKSIYRTMFMDGDDSFDRTSVNFSNIPDLMDRFEERLAMASGMSVTRFLGKAPSGLNATGEGDQRNDSKSIRIRQTQILDPFYRWIDPIIARSTGTEVPEYLFPALFEMSDKESSEVESNRGRTIKMLVETKVWTADEAKDYMATGVTPKGKAVPKILQTA